MQNFIIENWAALIIAIMALTKVIVNLTPTTSDNRIFGWIDILINAIISDRRKWVREGVKDIRGRGKQQREKGPRTSDNW